MRKKQTRVTAPILRGCRQSIVSHLGQKRPEIAYEPELEDREEPHLLELWSQRRWQRGGRVPGGPSHATREDGRAAYAPNHATGVTLANGREVRRPAFSRMRSQTGVTVQHRDHLDHRQHPRDTACLCRARHPLSSERCRADVVSREITDWERPTDRPMRRACMALVAYGE